MTIGEAAAYLNVTHRYVRHLIAQRRIAYHKVGRLVRIRRQDLDRFFGDGRVEPMGANAHPTSDDAA